MGKSLTNHARRLTLLPIWLLTGAVMAALLCGPPAQAAGTFPPLGQDIMETAAVFRVISLDGTVDSVVTLYDPVTIVGRSNPNCGSYGGAGISGGGTSAFPGTAASGFGCRLPRDFLWNNPCRRWVGTEILSLSLQDAQGIFSVRAGSDYWLNAPPAIRNSFYQNSFGLVASQHINSYSDLCCVPIPDGGTLDTLLDFPADSYFDVYAQIEVLGNFYYNLQPMVIQKKFLSGLPPTLALPQDDYIHDSTFSGVLLFDDSARQWGWLLSAGHGGNVSGAALRSVNSPLMLKPSHPVMFTIGPGAEGLPASFSSPNHVREDFNSPEQQVTVYQTSGADPGAGADWTNRRETELVGNTGGQSGEFSAGDALNSFSFGMDGTRDLETNDPTAGTMYFSVDGDAQGQSCTDVYFCANSGSGRQAGPVFVDRVWVSSFGSYADIPVPPLEDIDGASTSNDLAVDGTALGLSPWLYDSVQGDVTGLELSEFESCSKLYGTFTGPSFSASQQEATIFIWDRDSGDFQLGNLFVFADPASMGLVEGDIIDALVLSDVTVDTVLDTVFAFPNGILDPQEDEVLFSLAPGSPSILDGISDSSGWSFLPTPGTIIYSDFNGDASIFKEPANFGLLPNWETPDVFDNVDALDIRPTRVDADISDFPSPMICNSTRLVLHPDTLWAFQAWMLFPDSLMLYMGGGLVIQGPIIDIDLASLRINDSLIPQSVIFLPQGPIFNGPEISMFVNMREFILSYGALYRTTVQSYTVTGNLINGDPIETTGMFVFRGHAPGDITLDGNVDIADLTYLVDYLFGGGPAPRVMELADVNGSGTDPDVADLVYLADYLFGGGPPPQIP